MATRDSGGQSQSHRNQQEDEIDEAPPVDPEATERREKMSEDVDDLLDEIDGVLEENAEEFVKGYVQKGGE